MEAPMAAHGADAGQPDAKPRALLVEDNEINQEIACELLRGLDLDVTVADNGAQALEAVRSGRYAIIFMDIEMPVMDGVEAARRIRASGIAWAEKAPIIAMTAHAPDGERARGLTADMNAHVAKPVDPLALRRILETWLPRRPAAAGADDPARHGETRIMHGINTAAGIANVAGNDTLYFDLLRRFALKYRDSRHELPALLEKGDAEGASRLAHTIKGVAANLGIACLADIAKKIETALLASEPITPLLDPYAREMAQVIHAIDSTLSERTPPKTRGDDQTGNVDAAAVPRILETLAALPQLMQTDWGQAREMLESLTPLLEHTADGPACARLSNALEEFDAAAFAAAAEALAGQLRQTV